MTKCDVISTPKQNPGDITIAVGNTVYTARGFYKPTGKTLSEKLLRNMGKDLQFEKAFISGDHGKSVVEYE